ncbi:S-layer homology domain-containing protein [Cohnella endophytica]|uniref:S-layer homology domain-containing protein n=1 Tax=Cohnella endophytica TaxID=2419778 RepID=UPI0013147700|nr:S-layer homology domain-containing protein [Cohnella endophytica]
MPTQRSEAAQINRFWITDPMTKAQVTYVIAGKLYNIDFDTDKASTTSFENRKLEYSTDNGATWVTLVGDSGKQFWTPYIYMPIDPRLVSAKFRLSTYFNPLIGDRHYSEKIIGPYKILQPASITDAIATPKEDGKVTLTWNDNSNMESNYIITRYGPDGTKTFYKNNTTDHIGPLSYDDQTDSKKSSVYIYKLSMVIDRYGPDYGTEDVYLSVKTKVPPTIIDQIKDVPIIQTNPIDIKVNKYLVDFDLNFGDLNKVAVSGVKLNAKAITLNVGETQKLIADVTPANAANREVTWSIDSQIADVDSAGKVTGRLEGMATIKVKSVSGGFTDYCVVTVMGTPQPPTMEPPLSPISSKFTDITGNAAKADIEKAVDLGVVFGYPDGTFRPNEKVTRAEFASMLIRGLKPAEEGKPLPFIDKNEVGAWALPALEKAYKLGIIHGYSDKSIRPNNNITHAEMIVMVVNAAKLPLNDKPTSLTDDGELPKWAKPSVSTAEETGIIIVGGLPDGKFMPQALTTRAEAASAVVRMLMIGK